MKKNITEFIGTFFLVFVIGAAVASGSTLAPVAIGGILMAMIYAGGEVSGAHYNPAVSLAVFLRGKMTMSEMFQYMGFQIAGGLVGAMLSYFVSGGNAAAINMAAAGGADVSHALIAEAVGAFAIVYAVLAIGTSPSDKDDPFCGIAIGFIVIAMAVSVGGISGGAFNPAVGLGRCLASVMTGANDCFSSCWLYIAGPVLGSVVAVFTFKYLHD